MKPSVVTHTQQFSFRRHLLDHPIAREESIDYRDQLKIINVSRQVFHVDMMQQKIVTVNYKTARDNIINERTEGMSSQMT
jgi:hypothetical protein